MAKLTRLIGPALALALLASGAGARAAVPEAGTVPATGAGDARHAGWSEYAGFDLASRGARSSAPAFRLQIRQVTTHRDVSFDGFSPGLPEGKGRTIAGPSWSYQAATGGPVLELAALGGGMKGAPRLLHLALDWDF